jgi:hypothetical protein
MCHCQKQVVYLLPSTSSSLFSSFSLLLSQNLPKNSSYGSPLCADAGLTNGETVAVAICGISVMVFILILYCYSYFANSHSELGSFKYHKSR